MSITGKELDTVKMEGCWATGELRHNESHDHREAEAPLDLHLKTLKLKSALNF